MSVNENGNLRPDGVSLYWTPSIPRVGQVGVGGTWYWNPGGDDAPHVTFTGMYGKGRDVWRLGPPLASFNGGLVFRRNGMTSADSLGPGTSSNVSTVFPSVSVNTSIPSKDGIPQPSKNKVSSIEAGLSTSVGASRAYTYTLTPQQLLDLLSKHGFIEPAMGPEDELSPLERSLRRGTASVGPASEPPVRFLRSRPANVPGEGMDNWNAPYLRGNVTDRQGDAGVTSGPAFSGRVAAVPYVPQVPQGTPGGIPGLIAAATGSASSDPTQFQPPTGGILGMIQDYMNSNAMPGR